MMQSVGLLSLVALYLIGSSLAAPEKVEHGNHGAEKHKPVHFKGSIHNEAYDYEALFGSRDYEELAELPDDKKRARLVNLAKSHDKNNNGLIETEELEEWIMHSFRMLDHQEAVERQKDDDVDDDGKISFAEILKKQYGYDDAEIETIEKTGNTGKEEDSESEMMELLQEDKVRFAAADLNHDGFLDGSEFEAYYQPYDHPHMHDVEVERTMKELDEDKDGFISMEEFVRTSTDDEESRLSEVTNFENLDKNKDGKLTSDELKPWAVFDNTESAKEEALHLLKECDEDMDGHLSIDEIVKKEEDFIASQATDYGRHLHFIKDEL